MSIMILPMWRFYETSILVVVKQIFNSDIEIEIK